jgi:hypothetical protein
MFSEFSLTQIAISSFLKLHASKNLENQPLLAIVSEELIDAVGESVLDKRVKIAAETKIVEVVSRLEKIIYTTEAKGINDSSREAIRIAVSQTLLNSDIDTKLIVDLNLDAHNLTKHLMKHSQEATKLFSQNETAIFRLIIDKIAHTLVEESTQATDFLQNVHRKTLSSLSKAEVSLSEVAENFNTFRLSTERSFREINEKINNITQENPTKSVDLVNPNELLLRLNNDNPDVKFEMQISEEGSTLTAIPRAIDSAPKIGRLRFPQTPKGKIGLYKFTRLIKEGYPTNFEEGEYEWVWDLVLPESSASNYSIREIQLQKNIPTEDFPVRLTIEDGQKEIIYSLDFARLSFNRIGIEEQEVTISSIKLPNSLKIVTNATSSSQLNIESVFLHELPIELAEEHVKLRLALLQGENIVLTSLESEAEILRLGSSTVKPNPEQILSFKNILLLIKHISEINLQLDINLQYPEHVNPDILFTAEELYHALKFGWFDDPRVSSFTQKYNKKHALDAIDTLEKIDIENSQFMMFVYELTAELMGINIPLGETFMRFEELSLKENLDELKAQAESLAEEDELKLEITYRRSFKIYSDLLKIKDKRIILSKDS